jgi:hypothetical protein
VEGGGREEGGSTDERVSPWAAVVVVLWLGTMVEVVVVVDEVQLASRSHGLTVK